MGLKDIFLSSPDTLSLLLLSLILSGRPPSPPARHSVGSSSFSSSSRVAARGQTGSHHHIQTTHQALINSKQGRQCLELNQTPQDYNFILCGWLFKTTKPTSPGAGNGSRGRGGSLVTGSSNWPIRIWCDDATVTCFLNLFAGKFKTQLLNRFTQVT